MHRLKVVVRVRPLVGDESVRGMECSAGSVRVGGKSFEFGTVIDGLDRFDEVYAETAFPLVDRLFEGYNATVLAYGQTGSGKTFAMFGGAADVSAVFLSPRGERKGVVPRAVSEVLRRREAFLREGSFEDIKVSCSLMEVYNEECRDLLADGETHLSVRDAGSGNRDVVVSGLSEFPVKSEEEVFSCFRKGTERRATAATDMNTHSSRSHMIATLKIETKRGHTTTTAKLHLVDLAGSERAKRTGATTGSDRFKEGVGINKSLLALGNVVARLADLCVAQPNNNENLSSGTRGDLSNHVPYRDSTLTRVLADSLGGSALAVMIACVSPADRDADESANTLRWASRATKITNVAKKNLQTTDTSTADDIRRRLAREVALRSAAEARCLALNALNSQLSRRVDVLRLALGDAKLADAAESSIFRDGEQEIKLFSTLDKRASGDDDNRLLQNDDDDDDDKDAANAQKRSRLPGQQPRNNKVLSSLSGDHSAATASALEAHHNNPTTTQPQTADDDEDEEEEAILDDEAKIEALRVEERCMENLRVHYEEAISRLEREVVELERERSKHMESLQREDKSASSEREKRVLREKTRELEKRLGKLRLDAAKALSDAKRCSKLQQRAEAEASALRSQVDEARRRRGELQKALQHKDAAYASKANEWRREARRLKRDRDRLSGEKRRMAEDYARAERTRLRQLAQSRAQIKRLRVTTNFGALAIINKNKNNKKEKAPSKTANNETTAALPDWLEDEIERRVETANVPKDADDDEVRRLEDLAWNDDPDVWWLLNSVCDDLAKTRAAVRAAKASDAAAADETRQWLTNERAAYQKRRFSMLGMATDGNGTNGEEVPVAGPDDDHAVDDDDDDGDEEQPDAAPEEEEPQSSSTTFDEAKLPIVMSPDDQQRRREDVLDEYSARCQRMRKTSIQPQQGLDGVAEKLRAVKSLVSDVRAARQQQNTDDASSRLLRGDVKREYEKPWTQNANLDPTLDGTVVAMDELDKASRPKHYDRPWRVNANLPPPPPGHSDALLKESSSTHHQRVPLVDIAPGAAGGD